MTNNICLLTILFLAAAGVAGFMVGRMIRASRDASNGSGGHNGSAPRALPSPQQTAAGYGMEPTYTSNAPTTPMGTRS